MSFIIGVIYSKATEYSQILLRNVFLAQDTTRLFIDVFFAVLTLACILYAVRKKWVRATRMIVLAAAIYGLNLGALIVAENQIGPERAATLLEMHRRPSDPWPRGTAHIPLGRFGVAETEKGYLEPGGSFSPAAGSLGISFWVTDGAGNLISTSDDIPIDQTSASYGSSTSGAPAVQVETPFFRATWTAESDGSFTLDVVTTSESRVDLVLRGVGPAGGPLTKIERSGRRILTSSGWTLETLPVDAVWSAGEERSKGWTKNQTPGPEVAESSQGWAYGRVSGLGRSYTLRLSKPTMMSQVAPNPPSASLGDFPMVLDGADAQFVAALQAQVLTLQQGLVGNETRPGEPLNYPLEWLRDGTYVVVALLRSGHHETARQLALAMAPKDFFGGFGSEADAPGLALWMLGELSESFDDAHFDTLIWAHVQRKAEIILRLLNATGTTTHAFTGPVVPWYQDNPNLETIAYGTREGLIDGRMDWHRPLFYVNASAFAGLTAASKIASRMGKAPEAEQWRHAATDLQVAWRRAFDKPSFAKDRANDRTAISGLWPFSIADAKSFERLLNDRRQFAQSEHSGHQQRPLWSYFSLAEAHQWLRLSHPEYSRATLDRLWQQSPFPGLYTFWEGNKEENSFGRWKQYRGWVNPPTVTPHYWSSAEALLLQISMIAEAFTDDHDVLLIGAGVPQAWLNHPLHFSDVGTAIGRVSWT